MKRNKKIFSLLLFLFSFFLFSCSEEKLTKYEESKFLFGTYIKIIVYDSSEKHAKQSIEKAFNEIERIDNKYNSKVEGSIVYKLNNSENKEAELDDEAIGIFKEVSKAYELSKHKYDITIGPLLELWGFTDDEIDSTILKIPSEVDIAETKKSIDFEKVRIDGKKIKLENPIKEIDTGSFLKGYALSKAKEILVKEDIKKAFITSISSITLIGDKPEGKPWKIGLQNPEKPEELIGIVPLKDKSMGVSGDYQTYVEIAGKKYHHILNKDTGYPETEKKMVVVVCDDSFQADLLSTTFFLMPTVRVLNFVESQKDMEVLIIDKNMNIIKSKNFMLDMVKK